MTQSEVRQTLADHAIAVRDRRGLIKGKNVTARLASFDPRQRYRKGPAPFQPFSDKGDVNFPKFFRRQADPPVKRAIQNPDTPAGFLVYLASKKDDIALPVKTFLNHKGPATGRDFKKQFKQLATFVKQGRYPIGPEVVFWEGDAKLVKAGTNKTITAW